MKTFKQFNEGLKNRSALKLAGELGGATGFITTAIQGIRKKFKKKDVKQQKSNPSVQDIGL
tara:strand:+ start:343 stop:525 length:183 start_codon:yes stop_codon:yes gene_type:complete